MAGPVPVVTKMIRLFCLLVLMRVVAMMFVVGETSYHTEGEATCLLGRHLLLKALSVALIREDLFFCGMFLE